MHNHRYNTRSRAPKAPLDTAAAKNQASNPQLSTVAKIAGTQPMITKKQDSTKPLANTAQDKATTPKLFTLPDELQAIIYKQNLIEAGTIHLRVFIGNRTDKKTRWHVDTRINGRRVTKPPILAVCKYLRNFIMPLYLAGNIFSGRPSEYDEVLKMQVLHNMWGEHTKHIRCIEYWTKTNIRFISQDYWNAGVEKTEQVSLVTMMKLLAGGILVLSRRSSGTHGSGNLPEGEMCHCDLDRLAASSSLKGNDQRRLVEIMAHCATFDRARASSKVCSRCNHPCLADIKRFQPA